MTTMTRGLTRRSLLRLLGGMPVALGASACAQKDSEVPGGGGDDGTAEGEQPLSLLLLNCTASVGMAPLVAKAQAGETNGTYITAVASKSQQAYDAFIAEAADVAVLPATMAADLYNDTGGAIGVFGICSFGAFSLMTMNRNVKRISNLRGRTLYLQSGNGNGESVVRRVLQHAGIEEAVTISYMGSAAEIIAELSYDPAAVGVLAEPYASAAVLKNSKLRRVFDLADEWERAVTDSSKYVGYVLAARKTFVDEHPQAILTLLDDVAASVDEMNTDPTDLAQTAIDLGLIGTVDLAVEAVPHLHLMCLTGRNMRLALIGFLRMYYDIDPNIVGGAMPAYDFYLTNIKA